MLLEKKEVRFRGAEWVILELFPFFELLRSQFFFEKKRLNWSLAENNHCVETAVGILGIFCT
jgi:hypothetical protein